MNADLENELNGLGPEYRSVVARLRAAREVEVRVGGIRRGIWNARRGYLAAASLLLLVGLSGVWLRPSFQSSRLVPASACPHDYLLSVDEMIATQRPDGGWQNDFLTRRNADVLKTSSSPLARIAYKRAMRNLRLKGAL